MQTLTRCLEWIVSFSLNPNIASKSQIKVNSVLCTLQCTTVGIVDMQIFKLVTSYNMVLLSVASLVNILVGSDSLTFMLEEEVLSEYSDAI